LRKIFFGVFPETGTTKREAIGIVPKPNTEAKQNPDQDQASNVNVPVEPCAVGDLQNHEKAE
jgi:hypothetical protein